METTYTCLFFPGKYTLSQLCEEFRSDGNCTTAYSDPSNWGDKITNEQRQQLTNYFDGDGSCRGEFEVDLEFMEFCEKIGVIESNWKKIYKILEKYGAEITEGSGIYLRDENGVETRLTLKDIFDESDLEEQTICEDDNE